VTSAAATLTVTARAPQAGDLRFQQVDAASTVNGYNDGLTGVGADVAGRMRWSFASSIGSPLFLSPGSCVPPPATAGAGCAWHFEQFNLPGNPGNLGLSTGYGGDFYTSFEGDLQSPTFPVTGSAIGAPNSVITSLDLEPGDNLFAASWIQSSQIGGFDMTQQTVAPVDLQAAATQEGAHHRVITAISYNAGQVVYLSYGWQSDPSTVYETQVVTTTVETAATDAANLATRGYILTAMGGSDLTNSYLLVGTRVQGDTMARPFLVVSGATAGTDAYTRLMQPGYAMVGAFQDTQGNMSYLGER
jgi:hypothetical protein